MQPLNLSKGMLEPGSKPELLSQGEPSEAAGEALTVEQAIANLTHPDLSLRYYAAWWLGKFAEPDLRVVDALIAALADEADRTEMGGYPLRRNAARALGKLADARAVPGLITCLSCDDFYVREAAAQSLAALGDASCVPALMQLLAGEMHTTLVPGRPHLAQPVEAILEALEAQGATDAIPLIQPYLHHPMRRVQLAANRAMYRLTRESCYGEPLVQALTDPDIKVRRSALLDLGASGYLDGAVAIAKAPVESSFKLVALKNLLEQHLAELETPYLSKSACHVMALMDSLL